MMGKHMEADTMKKGVKLGVLRRGEGDNATRCIKPIEEKEEGSMSQDLNKGQSGGGLRALKLLYDILQHHQSPQASVLGPC